MLRGYFVLHIEIKQTWNEKSGKHTIRTCRIIIYIIRLYTCKDFFKCDAKMRKKSSSFSEANSRLTTTSSSTLWRREVPVSTPTVTAYITFLVVDKLSPFIAHNSALANIHENRFTRKWNIFSKQIHFHTEIFLPCLSPTKHFSLSHHSPVVAVVLHLERVVLAHPSLFVAEEGHS